MYDMEQFVPVEQMEELLEASSILTLFTAIPSTIFSLAVYIITAFSLYTIAQRRGIKYPWLAWIPVVSFWTLGAIADDYRWKTYGQKKARRKVLLGTQIAMVVLVAILFVICIAMIVGIFANIDFETGELNEDFVLSMGASVLGVLLVYLPLLVVTVIHTVYQYIALYELYKSCDPGHAVLYLVLSIFFPITRPVFLFLCRNKDDGMPLRLAETPSVTGQNAAEPWQQ